MDPGSLRNEFRDLYGAEPRLFSAPGRVNLIGEHTDYNDGFVLPMAIDRRTIVAAAPRDDRRIRVRSVNAGETVECNLDIQPQRERGIWLDYVEGVARTIEAGGRRLLGADMLLQSDLPEGGGLSSSAALEISVGLSLLCIAGHTVVPKELALAGQQAEHEYVGTRSGIMDQFIAVFGRAGHALLIDCRSLQETPIPMKTSETAIVVCDSQVKHSLASSEYNRRREECERGVDLLRRSMPQINALRDVDITEFERLEGDLPEPVRSRCRHVITENARTLNAARALDSGDWKEMGELMIASHRSLRDDYQVSCPELDLLVEAALSVDGVYGSRMTGGGFGGSTVSVVERGAIDNVRATITERYYQPRGLHPTIYVSEPADGAAEIT